MTLRVTAAVLGLPMLLAACVSNPNECDPTQGGLFETVGAMGSGCYDQRLETRKAELSRTQSLTEQLRAENEGLAADRADAAARNAAARDRMAALEADRRRLAADVGRLEARTAEQKQRKASLMARMNTVEADIRKADRQAASGGMTAEAYEAEVERLTRIRDQLAADIAAAMTAQ